MGMYVGLGNDGFRSVRKGVYVDKTGLIEVINDTLGTKDKLTCVSRPRRFGKSFAAQMLCAYYDKSCDSRELFLELEIADTPDFEKFLNKFDVLYLDITWFISNAKQIQFTVSEIQEKVIKELCGLYPIASEGDTLPEALSKICEATGDKFIVIIDEWDALFREAKYDVDLQKEYIRLLRGLFKSSLTDKMIEAAYMTGILPIKKYGTQSALTDFVEYTMVQPGRLAKYTGFTGDEVESLCERYEMDFEEARRWYDGYSFRNVKSIYSPNSVIKAMKSGEYGTYWNESETYESLKLYIDMDKEGLKESIVQMLGGVRCPVDVGTFQNDMTSISSADDVLTLLVHLGYLGYDADSKSVYIPNEELRQEFIRAVKSGRRKELSRLIQASDQLLRDTLSGDENAVAKAIDAVHSAGTAPLFYNNEQALRGVIRFAYIACIDEYQEIQEFPTGIGYADVVYLPKKGSALPIMIIELKWDKSVQGAIHQVEENRYPQAFEGYGSEILLVGISYDKKSKKHTCIIKKHNRNMD